MKNITIGIFTILGIIIFTHPVHAQKANKKIQTETFLVEGVCNMCKKRIEKAALKSGVMSADWNKDTKVLTIIHKPKKVSLMQVKEALANAGHDMEDLKSTDEAYAKLPDCCAYRDGVETH